MKIRNVKVVSDTLGVEEKLKPMVSASIAAMIPVLESSHWDEAWKESLGKYKTRLEGELNPEVKKMTDEELALMIFNSTETDKDGYKWYILRLIVKSYDGPSNVIGYGLAGDDIIRVNRDFLLKDDPKSLQDQKDGGSNLAHEEMHNQGASHDSAATARRPNSAAYLTSTVYKIAFDEVYKEALPANTPVGDTTMTPTTPEIPVETNLPGGVVTTNPSNPTPVKKRVCKGWWIFKKCWWE